MLVTTALRLLLPPVTAQGPCLAPDGHRGDWTRGWLARRWATPGNIEGGLWHGCTHYPPGLYLIWFLFCWLGSAVLWSQGDMQNFTCSAAYTPPVSQSAPNIPAWGLNSLLLQGRSRSGCLYHLTRWQTAISHLNVFTQKEKVINAGQYIFLALISRLELPKYLSGVSTKEFAGSFLTTSAYVWKNDMDHCLSLFLGNLHVPKIYKQTTDREKSSEPGGKQNHFLAYDCQSQNTLGYSLTIIDAAISESHPLPGSKIALILVQEG